MGLTHQPHGAHQLSAALVGAGPEGPAAAGGKHAVGGGGLDVELTFAPSALMVVPAPPPAAAPSHRSEGGLDYVALDGHGEEEGPTLQPLAAYSDGERGRGAWVWAGSSAACAGYL